MKRLPAILAAALLFGAGTACDDGGAGLTDTDDTDTDIDQDNGTQIGSEGFWDHCETTPVEADEALASFPDLPGVLADGVAGTYSGTLTTPSNDTVAGTITLVRSGLRRTDDTDCDEAILTDITAQLTLGTLVTAELTGIVGIKTDGVGFGLLESAAWTGSAAAGFDPSTKDVTRMLLDARIDVGLQGPLTIEGCDAIDCETTVVGELVTTR